MCPLITPLLPCHLSSLTLLPVFPYLASCLFILFLPFLLTSKSILIFQNQKNVKLQRNGAELTLRNITKHFRERLPEKIPELWNVMIGNLERNLYNVPGECELFSINKVSLVQVSFCSNTGSIRDDRSFLFLFPYSYFLILILTDTSINYLPSHHLTDLQALQDNDSSAQEIVNSLQLLELLAPTMNKILQEKVSFISV